MEVIYIKVNVQRVNLLLAMQGHTQTSLAPLCGLSRQSISTILTRGTAAPKSVGKLAAGLGVAPEDIVRGVCNG